MESFKMYKISIRDNKAQSAQEVDFSSKVGIDQEFDDGKRIIRSMTIFARSEQVGIETANKILKSLGML